MFRQSIAAGACLLGATGLSQAALVVPQSVNVTIRQGNTQIFQSANVPLNFPTFDPSFSDWASAGLWVNLGNFGPNNTSLILSAGTDISPPFTPANAPNNTLTFIVKSVAGTGTVGASGLQAGAAGIDPGSVGNQSIALLQSDPRAANPNDYLEPLQVTYDVTSWFAPTENLPAFAASTIVNTPNTNFMVSYMRAGLDSLGGSGAFYYLPNDRAVGAAGLPQDSFVRGIHGDKVARVLNPAFGVPDTFGAVGTTYGNGIYLSPGSTLTSTITNWIAPPSTNLFAGFGPGNPGVANAVTTLGGQSFATTSGFVHEVGTGILVVGTPVPEPGTLALLAGGVTALLARRHKDGARATA